MLPAFKLERRFNASWSGAIEAGYERRNGEFVSTLGLTDGLWSLGVAAEHTSDDITATAGARYLELGDAVGVNGIGTFNRNSRIIAVMKFGYSF